MKVVENAGAAQHHKIDFGVIEFNLRDNSVLFNDIASRVVPQDEESELEMTSIVSLTENLLAEIVPAAGVDLDWIKYYSNL